MESEQDKIGKLKEGNKILLTYLYEALLIFQVCSAQQPSFCLVGPTIYDKEMKAQKSKRREDINTAINEGVW